MLGCFSAYNTHRKLRKRSRDEERETIRVFEPGGQRASYFLRPTSPPKKKGSTQPSTPAPNFSYRLPDRGGETRQKKQHQSGRDFSRVFHPGGREREMRATIPTTNAPTHKKGAEAKGALRCFCFSSQSASPLLRACAEQSAGLRQSSSTSACAFVQREFSKFLHIKRTLPHTIVCWILRACARAFLFCLLYSAFTAFPHQLTSTHFPAAQTIFCFFLAAPAHTHTRPTHPQYTPERRVVSLLRERDCVVVLARKGMRDVLWLPHAAARNQPKWLFKGRSACRHMRASRRFPRAFLSVSGVLSKNEEGGAVVVRTPT